MLYINTEVNNMAVAFATNNIVQCRLEYKLGTDVAYNLIHYIIDNVTVTDSGLPPAVEIPWLEVAEDIASDLYVQLAPVWAAAAAEAVQFTGITVQNIWPSPRSVGVTYNPAVPTQGDLVGEPLPLQDSPTILKRTNYGQRWGIGRLFFVGVSEDMANRGTIVPAEVTAINAFASRIMDYAGGTASLYTYQWHPVLVNITTVPNRINDVMSMSLSNNIIKTQRRRRPGKGI